MEHHKFKNNNVIQVNRYNYLNYLYSIPNFIVHEHNIFTIKVYDVCTIYLGLNVRIFNPISAIMICSL